MNNGDDREPVGGKDVPDLITQHAQGSLQVDDLPEPQKADERHGEAHRDAQEEQAQEQGNNAQQTQHCRTHVARLFLKDS